METITNRILHNSIESDLVYPGIVEYKWVCKLDKEFVEQELQMYFGVEYINNKYVILMPNGQMWYQHDNSTWLIVHK